MTTRVADPGWLFRIHIFTHPGPQIPDPKTTTKERGEKLSISSQTKGLDPRSGIRKNLSRIPEPGVKKAPDPGSGSEILMTTIHSRDMVALKIFLSNTNNK